MPLALNAPYAAATIQQQHPAGPSPAATASTPSASRAGFCADGRAHCAARCRERFIKADIPHGMAMALCNKDVRRLLVGAIPALVYDNTSVPKRLIINLHENMLSFEGMLHVVTLVFDEWGPYGVTLRAVVMNGNQPGIVTLCSEEDFVDNVLNKLTRVFKGRRSSM